MLFLLCFSILYLVTNVNSVIQDKNHYNLPRQVRDIYGYNHPPSVLTVPVAIVYEDSNRQEKSIAPDLNLPKSNDQDDVITTDATTSTEFATNTVLKAHFSVDDDLNTEPRLENEYMIPVAVLYDDEPKNLQNNLTPATKPKSTKRQQRYQKILVVKNSSQNDIVEKNEFASQENKASTIFPKRTQNRDPVVPILQSESYVFSDSGDFHFSYEGGDGTKAFMRGELRSFGNDNFGAAVEGQFSYIGTDGNDYSLTYTADENGYKPIGAHLPTPPPIPPAIARALKYLATKTTPQPVTESL